MDPLGEGVGRAERDHQDLAQQKRPEGGGQCITQRRHHTVHSIFVHLPHAHDRKRYANWNDHIDQRILHMIHSAESRTNARRAHAHVRSESIPIHQDHEYARESHRDTDG